MADSTMQVFRTAGQTAARRPVPLPVEGVHRRIKTALAGLLLGWFFLAPWLRWDRGPDLPGQAIMVDLPARSLFFFGLEFWPQDLPIATGALIASAAFLFYATTLNGRVWCGFACPQTVWTDLYYFVARLAQRSRVSPLGAQLGIALLTGFGTAAWFTDVTRLPWQLLSGEAPLAIYGTILLVAAFTFLLGVHARERVCLHMCPWPRFQSALLDRDSHVVTYEAWRGEARGKARLPLRADLGGPGGEGARGDCIDCQRCVAVCPTGVDIRNGLSFGCIGCGLCIDACDEVMTKIERPRGLIRFDSERNSGPGSWTAAPLKPFAAKPFFYLGVGGIATLACLIGVLLMPEVSASLEAQRNPLFVTLSDGSIRNDYRLRLSHRTRGLDSVRVRLADGTVGSLRRAEQDAAAAADSLILTVGSDRRLEERLMVTRPRSAAPAGRAPLVLLVEDAASGRLVETLETQFWSPET